MSLCPAGTGMCGKSFEKLSKFVTQALYIIRQIPYTFTYDLNEGPVTLDDPLPKGRRRYHYEFTDWHCTPYVICVLCVHSRGVAGKPEFDAKLPGERIDRRCYCTKRARRITVEAWHCTRLRIANQSAGPV